MERVGDDAAVFQRQSGSELTIDFGQQERRRRDGVRAVESSEALERGVVVGVSGSDRD
jgi:hypothetical protein